MQCRSGRLWTALAPGVAAAILAACTSGITGGPALVFLVLFSGSGQSGPIGSNLPQPLIVRVEDQAGGQPVAGVTVIWQVTEGGGSVNPSQSITDGSGQASTIWRLGGTLGAGTVTARLGSASVVFSATATTGPVATLVPASGNAQVGTVGTQLVQPLVVRATDAAGNPKAGVVLTFLVVSPGGTLNVPSAVTDADGLASVRWTLGGIAGTQTLIVSTSGLAPLTLTASATAGAPAAIVVDFGNNQSGTPGAPLPDSLRVRVIDQFGNSVSGVSINWAALAGSGTVSPTSSVTSANGRAATRWTLGSTGGAKNVVASFGALSVTFSGGGNVLYSSISSGGSSTCGITVDAAMLCWGYHGEGQLGIGQPPAGGGPVFAFPQSAAIGSLTFRQVVASLQHACSVTLSSIGYCWGLNLDGRLGTNNVTPQNVPTPVVTAVTFQMMAVGRTHSCALSLSARVYCWGYSGDGQLGIGPVGVGSVLVPTEVSGGLGYQTVAAGGQHTCAILAGAGGGAGYCWGINSSGQLGEGTTTNQNVPTAVSGGLSFSAIAAGYTHTCGLNAAGAAFCWGGNASGQLGAGSGNSSWPVAVSGGLVFATISAGEAHSCAVTAAGAAYCWGSNTKGQLGDGTSANRSAPVLVSGGLVFRSISAGDQHTCGVTTANVSYCWGDNQFGQLGDGSLFNRLVPTRVAFQP